MTDAVPLYRAFMLEIERRRHQLGAPMWLVNEAAGCQEHYYNKMQAVDAKSGRQARWDTLQLVVDALFPGGFDLVLKPKNGHTLGHVEYRRLLRVSAAGTDRKLMRVLMAELARMPTKEARSKGRKKLPRARRRAIAKQAARARWMKYGLKMMREQIEREA